MNQTPALQKLFYFRKLQLIQNSAARLITRLRKHDSITPALQSLHWLPIHSRIIFKILLQTFLCSRGTGPTYLKDLLTPFLLETSVLLTKTPSLFLKLPPKHMVNVVIRLLLLTYGTISLYTSNKPPRSQVSRLFSKHIYSNLHT